MDPMKNDNRFNFYKSHIHLNMYEMNGCDDHEPDPDFAIVAIEHELGHAIGLNHSKDPDTLMYADAHNTIQPSDVQAVKKLYHEK